MMRTCLLLPKQCLSVIKQTKRYITANQTAAALRPFYFAVHPDLFGQYPKERAVNEESLKHLNEYFEKLQAKKQVQPIILKFYVRNTQGSSVEKGQPQRVHIKLLQTSISESIKTVLRSCGLPLDRINDQQPWIKKQESIFDQPLTWDPSFYAVYGMRSPGVNTGRQDVTLSSWFEKNISLAQKRQQNIEPIYQEVSRLRQELIDETGLSNVIWDSSWSQTQHRAALKSLLRLCKQHSYLCLKDRVIVLSNATGICCNGNIMLKSNEVAANWLWILQHTSDYTPLLNKLPASELYLSTLLKDANIVRNLKHPPLVQVYLQELRRLAAGIRDELSSSSSSSSLQGDNSDLDVVVECVTGPVLVAPSGLIQVPSLSPGFLVIDFIQKHGHKARELKQAYHRTKKLRETLIAQCYSQLKLNSLTYKENILPDQVITCCNNLLEDTSKLHLPLDGASIQITNFFSVTSEGQMCIPWNYR